MQRLCRLLDTGLPTCIDGAEVALARLLHPVRTVRLAKVVQHEAIRQPTEADQPTQCIVNAADCLGVSLASVMQQSEHVPPCGENGESFTPFASRARFSAVAAAQPSDEGCWVSKPSLPTAATTAHALAETAERARPVLPPLQPRLRRHLPRQQGGQDHVPPATCPRRAPRRAPRRLGSRSGLPLK